MNLSSTNYSPGSGCGCGYNLLTSFGTEGERVFQIIDKISAEHNHEKAEPDSNTKTRMKQVFADVSEVELTDVVERLVTKGHTAAQIKGYVDATYSTEIQRADVQNLIKKICGKIKAESDASEMIKHL